MPIYVGYTQKRRAVKLLTAGDSQLYLCDPGEPIRLQADINDYTNIRNHVFEWVQVDGPIITLTKVDDFTSTFPFADTFDKTFRFYVDRNTPQEQFEEVTIFYTPTSIQKPVVYNHQVNNRFQFTIPDRQVSFDLLFDRFDTTFQWDFKAIPATRIELGDINAQFPSFFTVSKFEVLNSEIYTTKPNNLYLSFLGSEYPDSLLLPAGVYRFRTSFFSNTYHTSTTSKLFVSNPEPFDNYWAVNTQFGKTSSDYKTQSIIRFSNIRELVIDRHSIKVVANYKNVSTIRFRPIILSFVNEPNLDDIHSINVVSSYRTVSITRNNPSNIGNE